ncbi:MAG: acyltransferase family protein [Bacilli bacterium]|nr:acyltransferase family protein [Bacilli bacterium]
MKLTRNNVIDITKCIGILLVVLGHVLLDGNVKNIIYMFHMPLFFFVSGITFKYSYNNDISFKDFARKKFKSIMIPYFIFIILSFIYWSLIERKIRNQFDISLVDNFINIFVCIIKDDLYASNIVMWFLPCLFTSQLLFYLIIKIKKHTRIILIVICGIVGYLFNFTKIVLPYGIETSLIAVFYIYIGYIFDISKLKNKKNIVYNSIFSIFSMTICFICNHKLSMLGHYYGNFILFLMGSFSGIFITLIISNAIDNLFNGKVKKGLIYIGINSLIIMVCHEPIKRILVIFISKITSVSVTILRTNLLYSLLITFLIIITMIPIIFIINKYLPFFIGKSHSKEKILVKEGGH